MHVFRPYAIAVLSLLALASMGWVWCVRSVWWVRRGGRHVTCAVSLVALAVNRPGCFEPSGWLAALGVVYEARVPARVHRVHDSSGPSVGLGCDLVPAGRSPRPPALTGEAAVRGNCFQLHQTWRCAFEASGSAARFTLMMLSYPKPSTASKNDLMRGGAIVQGFERLLCRRGRRPGGPPVPLWREVWQVGGLVSPAAGAALLPLSPQRGHHLYGARAAAPTLQRCMCTRSGLGRRPGGGLRVGRRRLSRAVSLSTLSERRDSQTTPWLVFHASSPFRCLAARSNVDGSVIVKHDNTL